MERAESTKTTEGKLAGEVFKYCFDFSKFWFSFLQATDRR
jgi:hypothetical protein